MFNLNNSFFAGAYVYPEGDGWTLPGYFEAVPNCHGPIRFRHRPLGVLDREAYLAIAGKTGVELSEATAKILATRVKSWNVMLPPEKEGAAPVPAPINAETLLRAPFWTRLVNLVIYGTEAGDADPEWSKEDKQLLKSEAMVDALMRGESINSAAVEKLAKN